MNDIQTTKLNILKDLYGTDNFDPLDHLIPAKKKEVLNFKHRFIRDSFPAPALLGLKVRRQLRRVTHRVRRLATMGVRPVAASRRPEVIRYKQLGSGR